MGIPEASGWLHFRVAMLQLRILAAKHSKVNGGNSVIGVIP